MRESASGGWLGTGEDAAGDSMMEVAEEHLSRVMAAQGGIGLANLVTQGIEDAQRDVSNAAVAHR
jgi:Rod binding domain-containing protein